MSDAEKVELIEYLAHSVRAPWNDGRKRMAAAQKQQLVKSVRRISALPIEGPGGFSGCDHDEALYGRADGGEPPA